MLSDPPCIDPAMSDVIEGVPALYTLRGTERQYLAEISHLMIQTKGLRLAPVRGREIKGRLF